ncbi:MAG TPA: hypothetical protein VGE39_20750 [Prosthecobacter sp.]
MSAYHLLCLAILAVSAACMRVEAQTVEELQAEPILSGETGLTVANQYMTRGFVVQDEGASFQPHFDLSARLYEGEGFINRASALIGLWAVLSSTPYADTEHSGGQFTELDYGFGVSIGFAKRWTFTTFYNRWTSPTGAYEDGDWILAALEFDDHGLFPGTFSMGSFIQILHEFNSDLAPGLCFEPGIRPNVTFFPESDAPVNAGVLMMAGLGRGFYGVDYGYFAIGPQLSVPLGFISPAVEKWTVYAEFLYYDYGITTAAENGQEHSWLVSLKVSVSF